MANGLGKVFRSHKQPGPAGGPRPAGTMPIGHRRATWSNRSVDQQGPRAVIRIAEYPRPVRFLFGWNARPSTEVRGPPSRFPVAASSTRRPPRLLLPRPIIAVSHRPPARLTHRGSSIISASYGGCRADHVLIVAYQPTPDVADRGRTPLPGCNSARLGGCHRLCPILPSGRGTIPGGPASC